MVNYRNHLQTLTEIITSQLDDVVKQKLHYTHYYSHKSRSKSDTNVLQKVRKIKLKPSKYAMIIKQNLLVILTITFCAFERCKIMKKITFQNLTLRCTAVVHRSNSSKILSYFTRNEFIFNDNSLERFFPGAAYQFVG